MNPRMQHLNVPFELISNQCTKVKSMLYGNCRKIFYKGEEINYQHKKSFRKWSRCSSKTAASQTLMAKP